MGVASLLTLITDDISKEVVGDMVRNPNKIMSRRAARGRVGVGGFMGLGFGCLPFPA